MEVQKSLQNYYYQAMETQKVGEGSQLEKNTETTGEDIKHTDDRRMQ